MKRTISFLIAAVLFTCAVAVSVPTGAERMFSDVEDGRWSAESIEYAVKNGYMKGGGEATISSVFSRPDGCDGITFFSSGGTTVIEDLTICEMGPIR